MTSYRAVLVMLALARRMRSALALMYSRVSGSPRYRTLRFETLSGKNGSESAICS